MTRAEADFELSASIDRVFEFIKDPEKVGYCIAGIKEVKTVSPVESEWKVEISAGFVSQTIWLTGRITEIREPSYISFSAVGDNIMLSGITRLMPIHEGHTKVRFEAEVNPKGPLSALINLVMKGTQKRLIEESISNIRKKLEEL